MTWEGAIPVTIGISGLLWSYIGFNLDKDSHGPIRFLMIIIGLSHTLLLFPFLNLLIEANNPTGKNNLISMADSGFGLVMFPFIIVLTWFMVFIIARTVLLMAEWSKKLRNRK